MPDNTIFTESEGPVLSDKSEIEKLTPPFIAQTSGGLVIATSIGNGSIGYLSQGVEERMPLQEFEKAWTGTVFLAFPTERAGEPEYCAHREAMFFTKVRNVGLVVGLAALFCYLFVSNGIYRHVSRWLSTCAAVLLTLLDLGGLYLTYLLVQKSLKIHNKAADNVCRVLQEGGCDSILETKASKFFGIFGWSEVGLINFR